MAERQRAALHGIDTPMRPLGRHVGSGGPIRRGQSTDRNGKLAADRASQHTATGSRHPGACIGCFESTLRRGGSRDAVRGSPGGGPGTRAGSRRSSIGNRLVELEGCGVVKKVRSHVGPS